MKVRQKETYQENETNEQLVKRVREVLAEGAEYGALVRECDTEELCRRLEACK